MVKQHPAPTTQVEKYPIPLLPRVLCLSRPRADPQKVITNPILCYYFLAFLSHPGMHFWIQLRFVCLRAIFNSLFNTQFSLYFFSFPYNLFVQEIRGFVCLFLKQ